MPSSAAAATAALHVRHARSFSARNRFEPRALSERRKSAPASASVISLAAEGPSCLFVGPIETASKEMLEALYQQARDAYYSGKPLIIDDMFDKVELKLRLYGSQSVKKYPRCSLRQQSTYADAEEDPSQVFTLASVWLLLLAFGTWAFIVPTYYTIGPALKDTINLRYTFTNGKSLFELLSAVNGILFMGLGYIVGYPIASASVQALQDLWRNNLVALKGSCPNCGEEVFAFVRADKSHQPPHRAECHVCESYLEFRTKVEQPISKTGRRWVYGRVYLIRRTRAKGLRRM